MILSMRFQSYFLISSFSYKIVPVVGISSPPSSESNVVFPEPDEPKIAYTFPSSNEKVISFSTFVFLS